MTSFTYPTRSSVNTDLISVFPSFSALYSLVYFTEFVHKHCDFKDPMACYFMKAVRRPLIQYLKTFKKFTTQLRASPTMSFPQTCLFFLEAGQGDGWGCGPEQLAGMVPCASVYSVSQWRGSHSFWPCCVNILGHSGCSGGSQGPRYRKNPNLSLGFKLPSHLETALASSDHNRGHSMSCMLRIQSILILVKAASTILCSAPPVRPVGM